MPNLIMTEKNDVQISPPVKSLSRSKGDRLHLPEYVAVRKTFGNTKTRNKRCNVQKRQTGKGNVCCDSDEVLVHLIDPNAYGRHRDYKNRP